MPIAPVADEPIMQHGGLKAIENYWNRLRHGRSMPSRCDIDPADIVPQLPFVALVDVLENGCDFRFRLLGTALDYAFTEHYTGKRLSEIGREDLRRILTAALVPPARDAMPHRQSGLLAIREDEHVRFDLTALPLSRNGDRPDMLFLGWAFTPLVAAGPPS